MKKASSPILILIWTLLIFIVFKDFIFKNWRFNIIDIEHWKYLKSLWDKGYTFSTSKDWLFILSLLGIPITWLLGIKFLNILKKIFFSPILFIFKPIFWLHKKITTKPSVIEKKKKKIKVKKSLSIQEIPEKESGKDINKESSSPQIVTVDDDDDYEDEDDNNFSKSATISSSSKKAEIKDIKVGGSQERQSVSISSINDLISSKGFEVIQGTSIGGINIDYLGIGAKNLVIFMLDDKGGDWLADEERFNDEDPLWFSESSHRVSPVQLLSKAKSELSKNLRKNKIEINVEGILVFIKGKIINADDMLEVWSGLKIKVARSQEGLPQSLPTLETCIPESGGAATSEQIAAVKSALE
jgi:hypothetical protein